jgi:small subunit ribosomal protein S6
VKNVRKYEALLILVPNLEEEARNQLLDRFKGIVEKDGTITNIDEWGTRKLAYEINNYKEGYYVVMNFETTQDVVKELDRVSRISDSVMRHMIIREDE